MFVLECGSNKSRSDLEVLKHLKASVGIFRHHLAHTGARLPLRKRKFSIDSRVFQS